MLWSHSRTAVCICVCAIPSLCVSLMRFVLSALCVYSFSLISVLLFNFVCYMSFLFFFFSSRRRHTRYIGDWGSDVCSPDLAIDAHGHAVDEAFTAGGTSVVLDGEGFIDGMAVRIDGIDQGSVTVESSTLARFTTAGG